MGVADAIKQSLGMTVREVQPGIPMLTSKDELVVIRDNRGKIWLFRNGSYSWGEPYVRQVGGPYTSPESALDTARELGL